MLCLLRNRAPMAVSRHEIIEIVWNGNWVTGDKGLNQAIWNLRKSLGDNAHTPVFIRTLPRQGYQWLFADSSKQASNLPQTLPFWPSVLTGFLLLIGTVAWMSGDNNTAPGQDHDSTHHDNIATAVYMVNDSIVVEMEDGCQKILNPKEGLVLMQPFLSSQGEHISFTVQQANSCKTVTLSVADGSRQEFDYCTLKT